MSDLAKLDAAQQHISNAMSELRGIDGVIRFDAVEQLIHDLGDCHYMIDAFRLHLPQ